MPTLGSWMSRRPFFRSPCGSLMGRSSPSIISEVMPACWAVSRRRRWTLACWDGVLPFPKNDNFINVPPGKQTYMGFWNFHLYFNWLLEFPHICCFWNFHLVIYVREKRKRLWNLIKFIHSLHMKKMTIVDYLICNGCLIINRHITDQRQP